MRINVIGLGMVGLPTALLFAESGADVVGVDIDEAQLAAYRRGRSDRPLERDVEDLLRTMVAGNRLRFAERPTAADAHVIAVPTPPRADGAPDLEDLRAALGAVRDLLAPGAFLVLESTVPPGTTERLAAELAVPATVLVAHAPERVLPGQTLAEMRGNARIVGGLTPEAGRAAAALYARICRGRIEVTDARTAEFVKLIENTYRDVNIALANELSLIAGELGVDVWRAIDLANQHPRVHLHRPGPGVGGHCVGVAPMFLRAAAPAHADVLTAARRRNLAMPALVARQALALCGDSASPRIALLGLAYKPDIADDRDSPTYGVLAELVAAGARVAIHDPVLRPNDRLNDVLRETDCVVVLVAHSAYRTLDPEAVAAHVAARRVLDTTHTLDRAAWERAGFEFALLATPVRAAVPTSVT